MSSKKVLIISPLYTREPATLGSWLCEKLVHNDVQAKKILTKDSTTVTLIEVLKELSLSNITLVMLGFTSDVAQPIAHDLWAALAKLKDERQVTLLWASNYGTLPYNLATVSGMRSLGKSLTNRAYHCLVTPLLAELGIELTEDDYELLKALDGLAQGKPLEAPQQRLLCLYRVYGTALYKQPSIKLLHLKTAVSPELLEGYQSQRDDFIKEACIKRLHTVTEGNVVINVIMADQFTQELNAVLFKVNSQKRVLNFIINQVYTNNRVHMLVRSSYYDCRKIATFIVDHEVTGLSQACSMNVNIPVTAKIFSDGLAEGLLPKLKSN